MADVDRAQLRQLILAAEQTVETAATEALRQYLALLTADLPAGAVTAAAAPTPDPEGVDWAALTDEELEALINQFIADTFGPDTFDDAARAWPGIVDQTILPALEEILEPVIQSAVGTADQDVLDAVNVWRVDYLDNRRQTLAGIPDEVTDEFREKLGDRIREEGPDARRAADLARETLTPDAPVSKARAETIGRTETGSALNNGARAAWDAMAESLGDSGTVYQTWTCTHDEKTRPSHRAADGQRVKLGGRFTVGAVEMLGPHDPTAPVGEVANCRCTGTFDVEFADGADAGSDDEAMPGLPPASLVAAADITRSGCVMALLSTDDAARLAVAGGEDPAEMHVTLGYIDDVTAITPDEQTAMDAALAAAFTAPVPADAFATAVLNPDSDERDPASVLLVQSTELAELHDRVTTVIGDLASTTFPTWVPHVTVAYNATSDVTAGKTGPLVFDRLVMAWGDEQHDLTGGITAAATGGDTVTAPAPTVEEATDTAPTSGPMGWSGLLLPTDVVTADGRLFRSGGGMVRALPLTLSYQAEGSHGGEAPGTKVRVGRILTGDIADGGVQSTGDWLDPDADWTNGDAIRSAVAVTDKGIGTVSADVAVSVASYAVVQPDGSIVAVDPALVDIDANLVFVAEQWELMGATLVIDPAFGDARIALVNEPLADVPAMDPAMVAAVTAETTGAPVVADDGVTFPDGTTLKAGDQVSTDDGQSGIITAVDEGAQTVTLDVPPADGETDGTSITVPVASIASLVDRTDEAASLVASAGATYPRTPYRREWFEPVALDGPTRLTITEDGRVFGHIATWSGCHTGFPGQCVTPPRSPSGYAYFHTRDAAMDDGSDLPVGVLTVGGGHADVRQKWRPALAHYDESGTAAAIGRVHEDEHGPLFTGQVIHKTPSDTVEELRRSPLSGDWREVGGKREMIAALAVNTPGFPIPQAAFNRRGEPTGLVAAGVIHDAPSEDPSPETLADGILLPSGRSLSRDDLALVASMFAAAQRQQGEPSVSRAAGLHARLRLAG